MFSVPIALSLSAYHLNEIIRLHNLLKPSSWAKCIWYSSMLCVNDLLLLFLNNIPPVHHCLYVCMYHHAFIHSSTEGYLGFFKFWWSWIMVPVEFVYSFYMKISFHFYNKMTVSGGIFLKELPGYFPEYLCHFVLFPAMYENSLCILIDTWYCQ